MNLLGKILEHLIAATLVVVVSILYEQKFGDGIIEKFKNTSSLDNLYVVLSIVIGFVIASLFVRFVRFSISPQRRLQGFYVQRFTSKRREFISFYRIYRSFFSDSISIIGRSYLLRSGALTHYGHWYSTKIIIDEDLKNKKLILFYFYDGHHEDIRSSGVSKQYISDFSDLSGYFCDLEAEYLEDSTNEQERASVAHKEFPNFVKFKSKKIKSFPAKVVPSFWRRVWMRSYNSIINDDQLLDHAVKNHIKEAWKTL